MKFTPNFEMRRRISDRDRRHLSMILTLAWLVLTLTVITIILLIDYRRFESSFQDLSLNVKTNLISKIKENETVLESFSAYISGMGRFSAARANTFAKQIKQRFPHISQLEVAEGIAHEGLEDFIAQKRQSGDEQFDVKAFDYQGQRRWVKLPEADFHYPLTYIYPLTQASRPVVGLDMHSHPHLHQPLAQSIATGDYQTSVPFRLVEGDNAYVMFLPVPDSASQHLLGKRPKYIVLIVLQTEQLLADLESILGDNTGILIYHSQKPSTDNSGHLLQRMSGSSSFLPRLRYESPLEENRKGLMLRLEKPFTLQEISKGSIIIVLIASVLVFILSRMFILKRHARDIERARDEARLEVLASHDALTNLPNRHQLMTWLGSRIEHYKKQTLMAALFLDLDRFKQINDLYGHRTGDQVLQVVAERIRQVLRREDLAVRLGGDEFLVIFSGIASADKIKGVVDKLRRKIEAPIQIEKLTLFVGVSIGTALYPNDVNNPIDLIDLADQEMYKNKAERQLQKVRPINNASS